MKKVLLVSSNEQWMPWRGRSHPSTWFFYRFFVVSQHSRNPAYLHWIIRILEKYIISWGSVVKTWDVGVGESVLPGQVKYFQFLSQVQQTHNEGSGTNIQGTSHMIIKLVVVTAKLWTIGRSHCSSGDVVDECKLGVPKNYECDALR